MALNATKIEIRVVQDGHLDGKFSKLLIEICHLKISHLHVRTGLRKQKIGDYKIFAFFANAKLKCSS